MSFMHKVRVNSPDVLGLALDDDEVSSVETHDGLTKGV